MAETDKKKAWVKEYRKRPDVKTKYQALFKRWVEENREHRKAYQRGSQLKRDYGLTVGAFESLVQGQDGKCAVCGTSEWGKRGPMVDHDHATGDVRGILCMKCNAAAGMLGDSPEMAQLLTRYLQCNRGD